MSTFLDDSREELKRVDHLIYVSLKYTRTVDVIRNIIERIISAFDHLIDGMLDHAKKKKKIKEIPIAPKLKTDLLKELYSDDSELHEYIDFYLMLRQIIRAKYDKREEYRRHVTMISHLDDDTEKLTDIDILYEHYANIKDFSEFVNVRGLL